MFALILKLLLSIIGLIIASQLLVKSTAKLSKYFRVSFFAIGVVFMAVSTTIPELFLSIDAALSNASNIALGTAIGSNIADLAFVLGILLIIVKKIDLHKYISKNSSWWMLIAGLAPFLLLYDSKISKIDGLILLLIFFSYIYYIFLSRQNIKKGLDKKIIRNGFIKDLLIFAVGILVLLFSADYAIDYGRKLAIELNLPLIILGISLYALSTSLPELVFEIRAIKDGKYNLALGDLLGSIIANSALVLGVTAIINPIVLATRKEFFLAGSFMLLLICFVFYVVRRKISLNRMVGVFLVLAYFGFLILEMI